MSSPSIIPETPDMMSARERKIYEAQPLNMRVFFVVQTLSKALSLPPMSRNTRRELFVRT
jgi:hypothetical protein